MGCVTHQRGLAVALCGLCLVGGGAATPGAQTDDLRLPEPTYSAAVELWRDGQVRDALAALERETRSGQSPPIEALILRSALLGDAGRAREAEASWQVVMTRAVWMRTFARRALVGSLVSGEQPGAAEPFLAELMQSNAARHLDLVLRVAAAYAAAGAHDRAADHFRRVLRQQPRGPSADRARLGLARALEASGDRPEAMATLREAQLEHRTADAFVTARAEAQRLSRTLGETPRPFSESQYRHLARRLRNASRFPAALDLIEAWRETYPDAARPDHIESDRIATLYAQRANAQGVAACEGFYRRFPSSTLTPEVRQTDFRLAVRMADTERARSLGLALWEGRVPGATDGQRRGAASLLAAYLVAVGDIDGGLALYRELFQTAQSADDQRAMLWRAGVAALRDGQHERAVTNLGALVDRRPSDDLALAATYWLAVAHARIGATDRAAQAFGALAGRRPYHYYGLRAADRLEELTPGTASRPPEPATFPPLSLTRASRQRAEFKAAMALARAGLTADAAGYLRRLLERQSRDRGLALLAARASADAGQYASVARIVVNHFGTFLARPARDLPADFWRLVYPRPFWDAVQSAATSHDVDPVLLLSLMRQESRFDPNARSAVGAIGLMQVMPYTATALARRAGVAEILTERGVDETTLTEPEVNLAIAARLNGDLLALFDDALPPVVASYNAGEDRVAIWWQAARDQREDVFIDTIPYSETRRFVREVLANYAAYQRIYGTP